MNTSSEKTKNNNGGEMLFRNEKSRNVITGNVSRNDVDGIVKLYDALVPGDEKRAVDVQRILEYAFPKFEETVGKNNFQKVKKYFGIGGKAPQKNALKPGELNLLIGHLRTIENAQYYINGYEEMVKKFASKLDGAPEGMSELEKTKLLRMFLEVFCGYQCFFRDYSVIQETETGHFGLVINYERALENNKKNFYPEELMFLYEYEVKRFEDKSMFHDTIMFELSRLDKRVFKEVLEFAELSVSSEGKFCSVNKTLPNQTYGSVRNLKIRLHKEIGFFNMDMFFFKPIVREHNFVEVYSIYKKLKTTELEKLPKHERERKFFEGSRVLDKKVTMYKVLEEVEITGMLEAGRFIHMMEFTATKKDFCFQESFDLNGNQIASSESKSYNVGLYMAAIKCANELEYLSSSTTPERDLEVAEVLIKADIEGSLEKYKTGEISAEKLKENLGIDRNFEKDILKIERKESLEDAAIRFALEGGYAKSTSLNSKSKQIILNVILPGNEEIFKKFSENSLTSEQVEQCIGFDKDFSQMYFDLSKVNMQAIEEKLLELKRGRKDMKKSASLIAFYCYLVEEKVPCGVKNKPIKGNKSLKPKILRSLIA